MVRPNNPPTPPPKDESRNSPAGILDRKRSRELLGRDRETPSPVPATAPKSKFSAGPPSLGDLTFEKTSFDFGVDKRNESDGRRPPLESFVTAREGELRDANHD